MEENNNNENELGKKVKQSAKNIVNKGLNIVKKTVLKWLLPGIGIFLLILLVMGIILASTNVILNMFNSFLSIFSPTQESPETLAQEAQSIVSIGENGEYIIKHEFSDEILKTLENKKVSNEAMGFLKEDSESIEELEDMLGKYIETEVKTMFPKTGVPENEIDGAIKVQRALADGNNKKIIDLRYVPYEEFNNMTGNDVLNCFSLNPENFKLCIATNSITTYKDFNGNEISGMGSSQINKQELDYQTVMQNYAMPFNFLTSLHAIVQDAKFMDELVEQAVEKELVLTYIDSKSIVTTQRDYTGESSITTITEKWLEDADRYTSAKTDITPLPPINNTNVNEYVQTEYYQMIVETTMGTLEVTKADTWLQTVTKQIEELTTQGGTPYVQGPNTFFEEYNKNLGITTEKDEESSALFIIRKLQNTHIKETVTTTSLTNSYTTANKKREIKVNDFIEFIKSYPKVENNLKTAPSALFYLLQQYENTQKLEQIMRYVILMLSGVDYGVSEDELETFLKETFSTVSGMGEYQLSADYISGWENVATWHYLKDDGKYEYMDTPYIYKCITQDRMYFLCIADGLSTTTANRNFGFGVMHRSNSFKYNNVERYEKYGIDIDSGAYDALGCQLDVEIVQNVKRDIVSERMASYEKMSEENGFDLKHNQITAITAVSFQYGNIGNFVQAYRQYGNTEGFRRNFVVNGCLPFLTGYNGGVKRAQGNWDLFSKGIYRLSDGTILDPNVYASGDGEATEMQLKIVEIAKSQDTLGAGAGWCQMWVCRVYRKAGQADISSCCASSAGDKWIVSTDQNSIPLGACVYGYSNPTVFDSCGRDAGHVGIYIGDGQVASNVGGIRIESLQSWISGFGWRGWGWNGGTDYSK